MKPIYFIRANEYDGCNSWVSEFCHCHNKKFVEDLAAKLNKKAGKNADFCVVELQVFETPTKDQIKAMLEYRGFAWINKGGI